MEHNIEIIKDTNGKQIVVIHNIRFKGKRSINWKDVEDYLKQYVNNYYTIAETNKTIYIDSDFPDEYANSKYTHSLKGTSAKAKANAAQGIPEIIKIASNEQFQENLKNKHKNDAKNGWYRYESRFALPVFKENREIERYNIFQALILMRHAKNNNVYLYDIIKIRKEMSKLFRSLNPTQ